MNPDSVWKRGANTVGHSRPATGAAVHGSELGYMKAPKNDLLILEEQEYHTVR